MSDGEFKTFVGRVVFPKDTSNYPYERKAGGGTVKTYLFSVPALNGDDQLIRIEFWDDNIPSEVQNRAALMVSGKWNNTPYTNKDGEEIKPKQLNVKGLWFLGPDLMEQYQGSQTKAPTRRRAPAPEVPELEDFDKF